MESIPAGATAPLGAFDRFLPVAPTHEWTFAEDSRVAIAPHYVTNSTDAALWHAEQGGGLTLALSYQVVDAVRDLPRSALPGLSDLPRGDGHFNADQEQLEERLITQTASAPRGA